MEEETSPSISEIDQSLFKVVGEKNILNPENEEKVKNVNNEQGDNEQGDNEQGDNEQGDNKQGDNENNCGSEDIEEENASQMSLEKETNYSLYKELVALDDVNLVENLEAFICEICLTECQPKSGVILTECLHQFCKQCITNIVVITDDVEIKCPYRNVNYCCDEIIQHREIRDIVGDIIYNEFLKRSLSLAESSIQNTMHCQSPDCNGWVIAEVCNSFNCPVCNVVNCVICKNVHDPRILSCEEYRRTLNNPSAHSEAVLDNMIQITRQAMRCPSCKIVIEKISGCDGMQCSRCKTNICWATRGARWGPRGIGDTSGGCGCQKYGRKCHVNCRNCH